MSSLADEFLNDLEDSGDEVETREPPARGVLFRADSRSASMSAVLDAKSALKRPVDIGSGSSSNKLPKLEKQKAQDGDEDDMNGGSDLDEESDLDDDDDESMLAAEEEAVQQRLHEKASIDQVVKLANDKTFQDFCSRVRQCLKNGCPEGWTGHIEDHPEYHVIVKSNQIVADIDTEVIVIHRFVRDRYCKFFPDLETVVLHPLDYVRVVKVIQLQKEVAKVKLEGILPQSTSMVIGVLAASKILEPLDEVTWSHVERACDVALSLEENKQLLLSFVESRMNFLAPNVSILVGTSIAARLIGIAGGLSALAAMPSCNIQILGAKKKIMSGFSTSFSNRASGFIFECDIINNTPPAYRKRAQRVIGGKVTLCARVDAFHQDATGIVGRKFRAEIEKKIEKWQEPPPLKGPKALPMPMEVPKKKRGGRRIRRMKEKYSMSDLRKQANRVAFGVAENEVGLEGHGLGMLGADGSGKVRVEVKSKIRARKVKETSGTQTMISGFSTSIAFSGVQGIELEDPTLKARKEPTTSKYFGSDVFRMKK